jgi:WD40 repeat protein
MLVLALAALQISLVSPQPIVEVDTGRLKGEVVRLAWSPDGSDLYLQTIERDKSGLVKSAKHYLISTAGKTIKGVDQEPAWAAKYWSWKSAQASPVAPAFRIDVRQREETIRATYTPTGGAMARGGTANPTDGTSFEEVANAANQTQKAVIFTLQVRDEKIGEWTNEAVIPGVNFGWAPAPLGLLAFAKREGGPLIVLDASGGRQELAGTKAAVLPAWSDDGKRIAWLERKDRKKYELMIAGIQMP